MSDLPSLSDHKFWAMVRKRLQDFSKSLPEIAAELGVDCKELTDGWLAYKPPQEMNRDTTGPVYGRGHKDSAGSYLAARRFAAWRKAKDGVVETRRILEAQGR